uniref:Microtubule-associated protein Jupiter n=1 Tax=Trichuris muris TaxID=70415 RepID=A0A5S6QGL8_TRIMR
MTSNRDFCGNSSAQARESSDIFTARSDIQLTPRKVKNYQQSRIFGSAEIERKVIMKKSPSSAVNTQDRLFGTPEPSPQRRGRVSDTYRSSIFNASTEFETNSNKSSTENSKLNNSALENGSENGDAKTEVDGKNAPAGNGPDAVSEDGAAGKEMKSGAESNGEIVGNDTNNNVKNNTPTMQRIRQPPGGFSSGLW